MKYDTASKRGYQAIEMGLVPFGDVNPQKRKIINLIIKISVLIKNPIARDFFSSEWHHFWNGDKMKKVYLYEPDFLDADEDWDEVERILRYYEKYLKNIYSILKNAGLGDYPTPETDQMFFFWRDQCYIARRYAEQFLYSV